MHHRCKDLWCLEVSSHNRQHGSPSPLVINNSNNTKCNNQTHTKHHINWVNFNNDNNNYNNVNNIYNNANNKCMFPNLDEVFFFLACACSLCIIPIGPTFVNGGVGVSESNSPQRLALEGLDQHHHHLLPLFLLQLLFPWRTML